MNNRLHNRVVVVGFLLVSMPDQKINNLVHHERVVEIVDRYQYVNNEGHDDEQV